MKKFNEAVEKHTQKILGAEKYIWEHPETGNFDIAMLLKN